jgi:Clathrin light chain
MSNFPSIEEFDSGQVTATKLENDNTDLLNSPQDDLFAREQAALGEDADFFQSGQGVSQGEAAFFDGPQGVRHLTHPLTSRRGCTRV